MVVTICGFAWDGPSLPRFPLAWLVLLCFHVQGWALLVYISALNVTVGVTQTDWSK